MAIAPEAWQGWIEQVQHAAEILFEKTSKKGKVRQINLCDRLTSIALEKSLGEHQAQISYRGSCRNDGTLLHAEHVVYMLNQIVTEQDINLTQTHRLQMILAEE